MWRLSYFAAASIAKSDILQCLGSSFTLLRPTMCGCKPLGVLRYALCLEARVHLQYTDNYSVMSNTYSDSASNYDTGNEPTVAVGRCGDVLEWDN